MNKKVIVLGGSGFLGTQILQQLLAANFSLVACGNRKPCNIKDVKDIPTDVLDLKNLQKSCEPYDVIINCTGQATNPINLCLRLNSEGANNIAKAGQDKKIIQISSVAIYGTTDYADEATLPNPETTYGTAKYFAEYILKKSLPKNQLTIVRLSSLFGPNQPKGLFDYLINSFHSDRKLEINNNGTLARHYLHIEDAARSIAQLAMKNSASGIFNLVGERSYTIKELVAKIEKISKIKFKVNYLPAKPLENIRKINNKKLKKTIPLEHKHSVDSFFNESFSI